jgi:hypothetical protein
MSLFDCATAAVPSLPRFLKSTKFRESWCNFLAGRSRKLPVPARERKGHSLESVRDRKLPSRTTPGTANILERFRAKHGNNTIAILERRQAYQEHARGKSSNGGNSHYQITGQK